VLIEKLYHKIQSELRTCSRDRNQIRSRLRGILLSLELSIGPELEWTPEYHQWLMNCYIEALELSIESALAREDYEQVPEIKSLIEDIRIIEEVVN